MGSIIALLANLVAAGRTVLGFMDFFKKAGRDARDAETLRGELDHDKKLLNELAKEKDFRNRIVNDPAFRERVRLALKDHGTGDGSK